MQNSSTRPVTYSSSENTEAVRSLRGEGLASFRSALILRRIDEAVIRSPVISSRWRGVRAFGIANQRIR